MSTCFLISGYQQHTPKAKQHVARDSRLR